MGWCGISSESLGREHNRVAAEGGYAHAMIERRPIRSDDQRNRQA
jgi:hypothetical protein